MASTVEVAGAATRFKNAPLRNTLYPLTPDPPGLSTEAVHDTLNWLQLTALVYTVAGAEGGMVSPVDVTVAVGGAVIVGVLMGVAVLVGTGVEVSVGTAVGVFVGKGAAVSVGVSVFVAVAVGTKLGVFVGGRVAVAVGAGPEHAGVLELKL